MLKAKVLLNFFLVFVSIINKIIDYCQEQLKREKTENQTDIMEMKLLAAVADSAERAIENNVMVLDNSSSVKGTFFN